VKNLSAGIRISSCILLLPGAHAHAGMIPALANIPDGISPKQITMLNQQKQVLENELKSFQSAAAAFNAKSADNQTDQEFNALQTQQSSYIESVKAFNQSVDAVRMIMSMNATAKQLDWGAKKRTHLDDALNALLGDGDDTATGTDLRTAWRDILTRTDSAELLQEAAQGDGPGIVWSGRQSHEDCAVFALASAAGLPYSVAAIRATELIRQGEWRSAEERANPQQVIERQGLNGGEVIMLAEAFGRAEVVKSSDFAKTLKDGHPVMINVVPPDGNTLSGHEVVLSKSFQHGGMTWFEMVDSNHDERRYVSMKSLNTILQERGVAFSPEAKVTGHSSKPR
jgi:hypothetical protein